MTIGNMNDFDLVTLGPVYTFSGQAAKQYKPDSTILYVDTIAEVVEAVERGIVHTGILPLKNSLTGKVEGVEKELSDSKTVIIDEFDMPVEHFLVVLHPIDYSKLTKIYSHEQPLQQCRDYLKKYLPHCRLIAVDSTAEALNIIKSEELSDAAAICSKKAAKAYDMHVLANCIQDDHKNMTTFAVIV